jgi:2,5-diketo-D-gluconate reductase A
MSMTASTVEEHSRVLSDGNRIPILGLGVWQTPEGPACVDAVLWALELGYRHIDTAQAYGNEKSVGEGLRRSGLRREQVFITTKFDPWSSDPAEEMERSLERLGLDYVDLYLVHCPRRDATWAWPSMEKTHQRGYARSIGVSNFDASQLREVTERASVPPVVNQIRLSPFDYRRGLLDEGASLGVVFEAYSPLGTGRHVSDPAVSKIASSVGRTPAQVLLRWCLQHDLVVLPKSTHRERIEENAQIFDFSLSHEDMAELDRLDRTGGSSRAVEQEWW